MTATFILGLSVRLVRLGVSLVSFAPIPLCVASQRVYIVVWYTIFKKPIWRNNAVALIFASKLEKLHRKRRRRHQRFLSRLRKQTVVLTVENPVVSIPEESGVRQMRHHGHAGDTFGVRALIIRNLLFQAIRHCHVWGSKSVENVRNDGGNRTGWRTMTKRRLRLLCQLR